ncbi:MAG: septation protein SepH [Trueperella sp.]|nr:septation protein SepH [Trueperella sp.]
MTQLELLGLHPDGDKLSLNDADGNRYLLPITADLRAALRTDLTPDEVSAGPRPITPKEIQAHFRAGLSIEEVAELSAMPASQLAGLASPIFAERQYTAKLARSFRQGKEAGDMTLEELVVSRLISRGISADSIQWDSYRDAGEPWTLSATYETKDAENTALWQIDTRARTVVALNDEATWLTETQLPDPTEPWRPLNTPAAEPERKITALDAQPASAGTPNIDQLLADLDEQRGKARPMPDLDLELEPEFAGAHPAVSEPDAATDAQILPFPSKDSALTDVTGADLPAITTADIKLAGQQELPGMPADSTDLESATKKPRRNRPAMPSWDEIVFGYTKEDDD